LKRRTFLFTPLLLAAADPKPKIVLFIARGWRGLATPWAGDPDIQAPRLDAFAKQAVVFPRAYAAYPHPEQARSAILTGRYPHAPGDPVAIEGLIIVELQSHSSTPQRAPQPAPHFRENVPAESADRSKEGLAARYAAYTSMDEQFGKLLDGIDASNTIVVFTSDAGEQLGSHALEGDDTYYEETVRVPLAMRIPGVRPNASDMLVSHVDLMPTLRGLIGDPPVAGVQGRDLSWLITSNRGERPEFVFAEGKIGQKDEWRMLVLGLDKLVVDAAGDVTHLFNLASDPYENKNLARDPSAELKRAQLMAIMREERSRLLDFKRR
jgi:arylsulfatase A-like enzyme